MISPFWRPPRPPRELRRSVAAVIATAALLSAGTAWSADAPSLEERAAAIERASMGPDGSRVVLGHISRKLGIPVETLRAQREQTGLGWGELLIAHRLSRETRLPFSEVVTELQSGKGWAQVATQHNVDLGRLIADVRPSQEVIEQRAEDHAGRPDPRQYLEPSGPGGGRHAPRPAGGAAPGHGAH